MRTLQADIKTFTPVQIDESYYVEFTIEELTNFTIMQRMFSWTIRNTLRFGEHLPNDKNPLLLKGKPA